MATVPEPVTGQSVEVEAEAPPPDHAARRRPPSLAVVVGVAFGAWGLLIGLAPLKDNSFLTHLATGRLILDGGIPRTDPYSFTAAGDPWVVQSWLASLLYGLADELAGGTALRLLMGALTAGIAVLVWRLTRPATSLIARIGIAALALGIGSEAWTERPLLFGLLFLCLLLLGAGGRLDPHWALPIMWLWVNTHGSFPLGLVAIGLLALGRRLDGESPGTELRVLAWAGAGTLLGAVNPLGPTLLAFPGQLLAHQETLRYIVEWKSPTFDTIGQRLFIVQVVAAVLLLVRRSSYRTALPLVVFTAAALLGLRNIPVASLVMIPGMALGAVGLGSIDGARRSLATGLAALGLVALTLLLALSQLGQENFELRAYPVDAVEWLDEQGLIATETRLVSRDFVGNYLEALEGAEAHVFTDDRYDMFPANVSRDYIGLVRGTVDPNTVLERYDAQVVLWDRDTPLATWLDEADAWGVVYRDDDWVVACPRPAPGAPAACPD